MAGSHRAGSSCDLPPEPGLVVLGARGGEEGLYLAGQLVGLLLVHDQHRLKPFVEPAGRIFKEKLIQIESKGNYYIFV